MQKWLRYIFPLILLCLSVPPPGCHASNCCSCLKNYRRRKDTKLPMVSFLLPSTGKESWQKTLVTPWLFSFLGITLVSMPCKNNFRFLFISFIFATVHHANFWYNWTPKDPLLSHVVFNWLAQPLREKMVITQPFLDQFWIFFLPMNIKWSPFVPYGS